MKKLIIFLLILVLLVSSISAISFATIGMTGLNFISPETATVVKGILCVTSPAGLIACAEQWVEGKIFGYISGEVLQAIAEASPEAAKAIITYNQVQSYIDTGANILEDLKVNEKGEIEEGVVLFGEEEYDVGDFFVNLTSDDIKVSNAEYDFKTKTLIVDEGGFLKIKIEDEEGEKKEFVYENIKAGGIFKLDENGKIEYAKIVSSEDYGCPSCLFAYEFENNPKIMVEANTEIIYENGELIVYKNKRGDFGFYLPDVSETQDVIINILEDKVIIRGNKIIGKNFEIMGNKISGLQPHRSGEVTISGNKIINVDYGTRAIVNGIQHETWKSPLNLYYDKDFDPSIIYGNYFNYGKNKIWLGGSGFTSSLTEGNEIFPEYLGNLYQGSFAERQARLSFTPLEGRLEITKISEERYPLALDIKSDGQFHIANGKWNIKSDGNNIYAGLEEYPQFPISYDMRFNYVDEKGEIKIYDLDVESSFRLPLSEEERNEMITRIAKLDDLIKQKEEEQNSLMKTQEIKETSEKLTELSTYIWDLASERQDQYGQLDRAERAGTPEQVKEIEDIINRISTEIDELVNEKNLLEQNPDYKIISNLQEELSGIYSERYSIKNSLELGFKIEKIKRVFAEIISSGDGDAEITYSEFIEGFPVIKNTDVLSYYGEFYRPELEVTVSGVRLERPYIRERDIDILDLIVDSKYQTCADTQIDLRALYELEELLLPGRTDSIKFKIANGETLEYKPDGTYTMWDPNQNEVVIKNYGENIGTDFEKWVANVQAYTNTGSLRDSLKLVSELDNLKPGDLITLHPSPITGYGHTKGIKEILEIPPHSGNIYYRLFGGSDPAIDPEIYEKLLSREELIYDIERGNAIILTWE